MSLIQWAGLGTPADSAHIARRHFRRGHGFNSHRHDYAEIFWVESGNVANDGIVLDSGCAVLMAPGASHELRAVGDGGAILNVAFPAETWQRLAGERGSVTRARISSSSRNLLASLVADFIAQPATALRRDALILGILARCEEGDQADPMPPWLQDALDALDVDDLATGVPALIARCARSREHVARVCREFLSKSPTELINDRRLAAVEHDLAMGDEAVGEIAERYGFGNRAHFHQRFKERFGLSPAAWRRRHKASVL